jgi:hypothetical protein
MKAVSRAHASKRYAEYAITVGTRRWSAGATEIAQHFGCSRAFVRYHGRKAIDPLWHTGRWGGSRGRAQYSEQGQLLIETVLWQEVRHDPVRGLAEFSSVMRDSGFDISPSWVQRCFVRWGYSHKLPSFKNVSKFTMANIYYG